MAGYAAETAEERMRRLQQEEQGGVATEEAPPPEASADRIRSMRERLESMRPRPAGPRPPMPAQGSLESMNDHAAATGGDYRMDGRPNAIIPPPVRPDAMRTRRPNEQDPKNFRQAPPQILTEGGMEDPPVAHNPELPKLPTIDMQPSAPAAPAGKLTPDEQYAQALRAHAKLLAAHNEKVRLAMQRGGYDQSDPDMRPPVLPRPPAGAFKDAPQQGPRTLDQSAKELGVRTTGRTKIVDDGKGGLKDEVVYSPGDYVPSSEVSKLPTGKNSEIGIEVAQKEEEPDVPGRQEDVARMVREREAERVRAAKDSTPKLPNTPAGREAAKYEDMANFANNATIGTRPREEPRQLDAPVDEDRNPILGKDGKPIPGQQFKTRDKDMQPPSRAPYKHAGDGPTRGVTSGIASPKTPAPIVRTPSQIFLDRVRPPLGAARNASRFADPETQARYEKFAEERDLAEKGTTGAQRVAALDARRAAEEYVEPTDEYGAPAGSEEARKNRYNAESSATRADMIDRQGHDLNVEHNAAIEGPQNFGGKKPMIARNGKGPISMRSVPVAGDDVPSEALTEEQRQQREGNVGLPGGGNDPLNPVKGSDVWRRRALPQEEYDDLAAMSDSDRYDILADRLNIDRNLPQGHRLQVAQNFWDNQNKMREGYEIKQAPSGGSYFEPNAATLKKREATRLTVEAKRVLEHYPFMPGANPGDPPGVGHHAEMMAAARAGNTDRVRELTQQLRDGRRAHTAMASRQKLLDAGAVQNMNNPRIAQAMFNREVKENEGNPEGLAGVYRRWNRPDLAERVEQLGIARQGVDHQADLDAADLRNKGLAAQGVNLQGQAAVIDAKAKAGQPPKPTGSGEQADLNTRPSIQGVQGTSPQFGSFGAGFNNYRQATGSADRPATQEDQHEYFSLIYADATKGRPTTMAELNANHPVIGTALMQLARKIFEGTGANSMIPNMRDAETDGFNDSEKTVFFKQLQEKLGVGPEIASQLWGDFYKRPAPAPKEENA